jgi:hypothetical protein
MEIAASMDQKLDAFEAGQRNAATLTTAILELLGCETMLGADDLVLSAAGVASASPAASSTRAR